MDCGSPGPSVHGISQARILEWVAISSSRGSSPTRDEPASPALAGEFLTIEPPGKPQLGINKHKLHSTPQLGFRAPSGPDPSVITAHTSRAFSERDLMTLLCGDHVSCLSWTPGNPTLPSPQSIPPTSHVMFCLANSPPFRRSCSAYHPGAPSAVSAGYFCSPFPLYPVLNHSSHFASL